MDDFIDSLKVLRFISENGKILETTCHDDEEGNTIIDMKISMPINKIDLGDVKIGVYTFK